jgi:hypothetical protein
VVEKVTPLAAKVEVAVVAVISLLQLMQSLLLLHKL